MNMKAHHAFIRDMIDQGYYLSVWSFGALECSPTQSIDAVIAACDSVELSQINIYQDAFPGRPCLGTALIVPYGVNDHETIADYSDTLFIDQWFDAYQTSVAV